jgi:pimeloyl-ACP methyl ester carboxylesterase
VNIIVDDLAVTYQLSGKGKLIVLLHGWGDTHKGLAGVQSSLSSHYQVLSMDLPGFGGTQPPKSVWGLDEYAIFVARAIKKLDLPEPYAVIGHSNGGAIAIRAIATQQLAPHKLVLIAAAGIRNDKSLQRFALKVIAKTGNIATIWMPEAQRRRLRQSLYGTVGSDMLVVPELQETFKKSVRQDVQADAAQLTIPTLLIYALNDRAVPLAHGRTYHQLIKNSQLIEIDNAGHFVHLDQPEQVDKTIKEFLS